MPLLPGIYEMLFIVIFIVWIWSLVDVLRAEFRGSYRVIWLLLLIFVPPIAILYIFIGKKTKRSR